MKNKRVITTSVIGNALEFYDFTLYGVFAVIIAQLYFPSVDPLTAILSSWGAFAAGFIMRPFGAMFFGAVGDKFGRKKALTLSIIGMGIPTLLIGLLPTYEQIGIVAPAFLVICRLIQGLCTGGEYNGAAIFALEHVGKNKPGFFGGLITGSCVIGALIATGLGALVANSSDPEFYWRYTFVFGAIISLVGFYVRRSVAESPEYINEQKKESKEKIGFSFIFKNMKKEMLVSLLIGCLNGGLSYTLFGFFNSYLKNYIGVALANAMLFSLVGLSAFMIFSPILGYLMDSFGRRRYFMLATSVVPILGSVSFFVVQSATIESIILSQVLLGLATAAIAGPQHAFVQCLFPVRSRYLGISFTFCLGMALCGGTAPMILTYFIEKTGSYFFPAIFISSLSFLLFFAIVSLKGERLNEKKELSFANQ